MPRPIVSSLVDVVLTRKPFSLASRTQAASRTSWQSVLASCSLLMWSTNLALSPPDTEMKPPHSLQDSQVAKSSGQLGRRTAGGRTPPQEERRRLPCRTWSVFRTRQKSLWFCGRDRLLARRERDEASSAEGLCILLAGCVGLAAGACRYRSCTMTQDKPAGLP